MPLPVTMPAPPPTAARLALALALGLSAAAAAVARAQSDDPADWPIEPGAYAPSVTEPRWVVPSADLPVACAPAASNNNVGLCYHEGRLYLAWRTAPHHFASPEARIEVVSSPDHGASWRSEASFSRGRDVREPTLISLGGRLILHFVELGQNPAAFQPERVWRAVRGAEGTWSRARPTPIAGEVAWDVKVRGGRAYMTSYRGAHYGPGSGGLEVLFRTSADGLRWEPLDPARPVVYDGGVSEVAFEIDAQGGLVAITRNEDGDASGFGAHVVTAPADALARWDVPARADPSRYDSPRLFRHGADIYLLARRDPRGPFDDGLEGLPFSARKGALLARYSLSPKRSALYRVDAAARRVEWLLDLPGCGDTAFPAVARKDAHTFVVANYTSPLDDPDISWISGQTSARGTGIYLVEVRFAAAGAGR